MSDRENGAMTTQIEWRPPEMEAAAHAAADEGKFVLVDFFSPT